MTEKTKTGVAPTVYATNDYSIFNGFVGNRPVKMSHVNALVKSIAKNNMLAQNPIIVNKDMKIMDGQHRLAAAKANNWTIYYLISESGDLGDVHLLNTTQLNWTGLDYLQSYVKQGKEEYILLAKLLLETGITLTNLLDIVSLEVRDREAKGGARNPHFSFKRGELRMRSPEDYEPVIEALKKLRPYTVSKRVYLDIQFVRAVRQLLKTVSVEEFIVKIEEYGDKIEYHDTVRDYLRAFEEIINWKVQKNFTRLFS